MDTTSTSGNDFINSGSGASTIDGGAGNDSLNAASGNDTLVYTLKENTGATDYYMGGSGTDTVRLSLTNAEWLSPTVQRQVALYVRHLETVARNATTGQVSNGIESDFSFYFNGGTKLTVSMMEILDVWVDGLQIDFHAPVIVGGDFEGGVKEDDDLNDSGIMNFNDVNWNQSHTVTVTDTPMGTLSATVTNPATGDGNGEVTWSYTLDNNLAIVQALPGGVTHEETFTVTIKDSSDKTATENITVVVTGTNDTPVANVDTGGTTENANVTIAVLGNDTDADNGHTLALFSVAAPAAGQGTAAIDGNGVKFMPGTDFDYLKKDQTATVTVGYTMQDEHDAQSSSTVKITVTGTNDIPTFIGDNKGSVTEDTNPNPNGFLTATGELLVDDDDTGESYAVAATTVGLYGTFNVDADGKWTYLALNSRADIQALDADDAPLEDIFTVTSLDETATFTVTMKIYGQDELVILTLPPTNTSSDTSGESTLTGSNSGAGTNDHIDGTGAANSLYGGDGNDSINGKNGNDVLNGGTGNDNLDGQSDNDTLWGGSGDDTIAGGNDQDSGFGESGNDLMTGNMGNDVFSGGSGNDTHVGY